MKKILSLFLAIIMASCAFSVTSSAKSTYNATWTLKAKVNSTSYDSDDIITVAPGSTVYVTLSLVNNYYTGPTCAQIFYTSSIFTGIENASFNTKGKLYATCSSSSRSCADWSKISAGNRKLGWPNYDEAKLEEYKSTHNFSRVTMTPSVSVTTTAAKSINEDLLTMSFKVSTSAKNGTTGEISLPIESQRTANFKSGYFYSSIYASSDMTKQPDMYRSDLSFDCSKSTLKFKVSDNSVTINPESLTLKRKGSETLTATVNKGTVKTVNWSSSDTSIVTVDNKGNVTAVGKGTATITAKTTDGKYSNTCEVTVKYSAFQIILRAILGIFGVKY